MLINAAEAFFVLTSFLSNASATWKLKALIWELADLPNCISLHHEMISYEFKLNLVEDLQVWLSFGSTLSDPCKLLF